LVARVLTPKSPLSTWIETFQTEVLPARHNRKGKPLSAKTLQDYNGQLKRITAALGTKDVVQIARRDIAEYLAPFPPTYQNKMRGLLHDLFAHAVARGYRDDNPVEGTLKATEVVTRQRLTREEFDSIYAVAEPWLQQAMSLARITLQRRTDLAALTHAQVEDGFLHVTQSKTGAKLRIKLDKMLKRIIGKKGTVPTILAKDGRKVSADMLTKQFAAVRDQVLTGDNLPTFHEIRALGATEYRDRGKDPQALLGHIDPQMTRMYLDRHEVRWVEITL